MDRRGDGGGRPVSDAMRSSPPGRRLALLVALLLTACDSPSPRPDSVQAGTSSTTAPATVRPAPPAAVVSSLDSTATDPAAALARYLAYSDFGGAFGEEDGLPACPPPARAEEGESDEGWEPDAYVGIAQPVVLGVAPFPGDTSSTRRLGRAAVVRVARIGRDSAGWVGRLESVPDTLVFTLERAAGGWTVCGPAARSADALAKGFFEFVTTYERARATELVETRWMPAGTTWEDVARHARAMSRR